MARVIFYIRTYKNFSEKTGKLDVTLTALNVLSVPFGTLFSLVCHGNNGNIMETEWKSNIIKTGIKTEYF